MPNAAAATSSAAAARPRADRRSAQAACRYPRSVQAENEPGIGAGEPDPAAAEHRRFVVCGDNPMAYRLIEELATRYDLQVTAIVPPQPSRWGLRIREVPEVEVIEAEQLDVDAFTRARLDGVDAVGLLDQDDAGNVDAALVAQELNPDIRLVVRMFNLTLGARIADLLNDCVALSAAEIAAPAFVAAALDDSATPPMRVADRTLVAIRRTSARPDDVLLGLAFTDGRSDPVVLPPPPGDSGADLVLARTKPVPEPAPRPPQRRRVSAMAVLLGARLRLVVTVLVGVFVAGTAALTWATGNFFQSAYVTVISELTGANADPRADALQKVTLTALTVVSIALIPAITAAIVDSTVKARLRSERGDLPTTLREHVVVIGLGHVGTRVVRRLHAAGVEVVAIERSPDAYGIVPARELGIPVIIGDASRNPVLTSAGVATCRALVVVSTDDVTNLEISLLGRAAQPNLRVVLRLFDADFARRVQKAFAINISRSVSYLAAPAFAAAMLGRQVIATIPVRRRVLLVAELPVQAGSALEYAPAATVHRAQEVRLLAIRTGREEHVLWLPPDGRRIARTDSLIVIATRAGLGRLLVDTRAVPGADPSGRAGPLKQWETPRPPARAGQTSPVASDSPAPMPAERPTDTGSTHPA